MGVGRGERAGERVEKGTPRRRSKSSASPGAASESTPRRSLEESTPRRSSERVRLRSGSARKRTVVIAKPRRFRLRLPWVYRGAEQLLAAVAVTVAALAGLTPTMGSSPEVFVATLAATALLAAGAILVFERGRRLAAGPWRHALNAALLGATVLLAVRFPPWRAVRDLGDLLARERATQVSVVAHQVYAAYRRLDLDGQKEILRRAEVYEPSILEASRAFGVSRELLMGIAAAESSFNPRPSRDGGQGLFQVTSVPHQAEERARAALGVGRLDPLNQKHNAFVAAATLAEYADRMDGDLLLTLLAYNIGPQNGGLDVVMKRYGAHNFAQAQPYLQSLARDYPIRVLAGALAYRIWRSLGDLPRFEEGEWAARIRELGIPGLDGEARIVAARPG